ncbi:hypothetical protein NIES25_07460 [Nostoc linckia NIES-25]|nr:hypothetical protein NIES25_07460 [Nostoc linckia NIES-25]
MPPSKAVTEIRHTYLDVLNLFHTLINLASFCELTYAFSVVFLLSKSYFLPFLGFTRIKARMSEITLRSLLLKSRLTSNNLAYLYIITMISLNYESFIKIPRYIELKSLKNYDTTVSLSIFNSFILEIRLLADIC